MSIYGTDVSTFAGANGSIDCDPLGSTISGPRAVLECCARRLMSPAGSVPGSPNMGFDLMGKIGARMTPIQRERIRYDVEAELEKDERVQRARVVDFSADAAVGGRYRLRISVVLSSGTFTLTLAVSAVTIDIVDMRPAA